MDEGLDGDDYQTGDNIANRRVVLPSAFVWGYRYKKMRAANTVHLVSRLGRPTLFITATANGQWAEIERELLRGQISFDRPDVVCKVFASKPQLLLSNLRAGRFLPRGTRMKSIRFWQLA